MSDPETMAALASIDAAAEQWAERAGWRQELDQLAEMSRKFAGARLLKPGASELEMLILRQRGLIDRWVRQAFAEGVLAAPPRSLWQSIDTARKVVDETVLLRIEHVNFAIAPAEDKHRWEEAVTAYWTDFNDGGWVWHGLAGTPTHWQPIEMPK